LLLGDPSLNIARASIRTRIRTRIGTRIETRIGTRIGTRIRISIGTRKTRRLKIDRTKIGKI
jgi:hypothetical protein